MGNAGRPELPVDQTVEIECRSALVGTLTEHRCVSGGSIITSVERG
jgi:hypothetical protein